MEFEKLILQKLDNIQQDIAEVKADVRELKERVTCLEEDFEEFKKEMYDFRDEMYAFKDEMYAFKKEMYDFRDEMHAFKDEMYAFKQEVADNFFEAKGEREFLYGEICQLKLRVDDMRIDLNSCKMEIHSIFTLLGVQHDVPKLADRMDVTERVVARHSRQIGVLNRKLEISE